MSRDFRVFQMSAGRGFLNILNEKGDALIRAPPADRIMYVFSEK